MNVRSVSRTARLLVGLATASCITACAGAPWARQYGYPIQTDQRDGGIGTEQIEFSAEELERRIEDERNSMRIYRDLNRGVVNVTSVSIAYTWLYQPYPSGGTGSGSIVHDDGLVLTNFHVIKGAEFLSIQLFDGTSLGAKVVGIDPENDLALLRFEPGIGS